MRSEAPVEHDHSQGGEHHFTQEFWDDRYGTAEKLWSGQANPQLVAQVAELKPGDALDAGCGEGADAIWLAAGGWTVTAVDVSAVALERGAHQAMAAGAEVAARISWQREDLQTWDPGRDRFDLVSAQFMHFPSPAIEAFHRRLAAAVRPGGTLLIVSHHPDDLRVGRIGHAGTFRLAEEIAAELAPADWDVAVAEASGRTAELEGERVEVRDTILRAIRRG
jgi:SAM-dependent methyltransferase